MENKVICEVCPVLNIVHASGEKSDIRYCVMKAALRQAKQSYKTCGKSRKLKFNEAPVEEQAPLTSSLDELESAIETLEEQE